MKNKSKIIFKNYTTKLISSGCILILGFFLTPFLLRYLGHENFALFKLTSDWLSSFGIFEQALSVAVLAVLSSSTNLSRDSKTWYVFKSYFPYAVFFTIASLALTPFLPSFYKIPDSKIPIVQMGYIIGSMGFLLLPFGVLRFWLEFKEKSYLLSSLRIYQTLLTTVLSLLFAYYAYGLIGQFISVLIGNIFFSFIVFCYYKKIKKPANELIKSEEIKKEVNKAIHKLNMSGLIISFCGRISFLTDTILLGFYFLPTQILPFVLTQRLILMIQENLQALGSASWASLLDYYRKGEQQKFENHLFTLTKINNYIAIILLMPLLFMNQYFIQLWVGPQFYQGFSLTLIASLNAYFRSTFSLWGWCLSGNGNIKAQIKIESANAFVNFIFSLILIRYIGFLGPVSGTLIGCLIVYSWMFPLALRNIMKVNSKMLIKALVYPLITTIPLFFIFRFLNQNLIIRSWKSFGGTLFLMCLLSTGYIFFICLSKDEKGFFKNLVLSKIKKRNL